MALVMQALRDQLIADGIVRDPDTPAVDLPPLWLEPRAGIPAPGEGKTPQIGDPLVAALFVAPEIPSRRHEGFVRQFGVDLRIRSRNAPQALRFHKDVRAELNDRRNYQAGGAGGVRIQESIIFAGFSRLGADNEGFAFRVGYMLFYFEEDETA